MEEKLDYKFTYLTETVEDMNREMVRIRMILSNSRKTHYSNQEVMDLLEVSSATLKKWRDMKLIGYSAVAAHISIQMKILRTSSGTTTISQYLKQVQMIKGETYG